MAARFELLPDEEVLVEIRPHWSFVSGPLALSVFVIGIGVALDVGVPHTSVPVHWVEGLIVAVPCLWLAARVVQWRSTSLVLTSARLVEEEGVISRHRYETRLSEILSVTAAQTIRERVFGSGRLVLEISGLGELRVIDDVRRPVILGRVIDRRIGPLGPPPAENR